MHPVKLKKLISKGEGISVEFKRAQNKLPTSLFETICAFLNRNGGEILLGVNDNKTIEGIGEKNAVQLSKDISNLSNNPQKLFPSFLIEPKIIDFENKKLIYIFVPISSQVHKTSGKIFDRSTDGDFELKTDEQIKQAYNRKSTEYSENTIYPFFKEKHFAEGILEKVRKLIKINRPNHPWNNITDDEFYRVSGLYREDLKTGEEGFTLSAILLFGKPEAINSALPHYKIDALVRKQDLNRYDDRINLRCNLIESYDKLMSFVEKHLPDKFYLEGTQRISLRDKIFREIIANMLIHREYFNAYPSTFIIYNEKVVSENANKAHYMGLLTPDNYRPFPKNPDIARIFTQIGHSEELGTGLRNVFKYTPAYSGNNNIIFREEDVFITEIPLVDLSKSEAQDVGKDVGKEILTLITKQQNITIPQISIRLGVTERTIERHISKFKKEHKLKRIGGRKNGHWEIIK